MKKTRSTYRQLMLLLASVLVFSVSLSAQVPGVVSQYMNNPLPLNPAFAGSAGYLTSTLSHRSQWSGFEGAPSSNVLSVHSPLKGENFGLGAVAWLDKFGVSKSSSFSLMGTYRVKFRKQMLYFGLSGGIQQGQNNWSEVVTTESGDDLFSSSSSTFLTPAAGAGVYFVGKRYYASLSAPMLMDVVYNGGQSYVVQFDMETTPVYLNIGGEIPCDKNLSLRPSMMITKDRYQDLLLDVNLMVDVRKQIQIGASWRSNKSIIGLLKFQFLDQFAFAYAYDYVLSEIGSYSSGSHELSLQFDLKREVKAHNTRFF